MGKLAIELPLQRVKEICRRYQIVKLALFGSALRADFGVDSDVDMLVEFAPGSTPGLAFFTIERELAEAIGRPVDLNTPAGLSRYFRDEVLQEAEVLYDAS